MRSARFQEGRAECPRKGSKRKSEGCKTGRIPCRGMKLEGKDRLLVPGSIPKREKASLLVNSRESVCGGLDKGKEEEDNRKKDHR